MTNAQDELATPKKIKGVNDINFHMNENFYRANGRRYQVKNLIECSKDLPVITIPIQAIYLGASPWGLKNFKSFIHHLTRVIECDLEYPILLDDEGYIADGWHRLAKAIMDGNETIEARRITVMPEGMADDDTE